MLGKMIARLRREEFLTSPLAIVVNPTYIIRNGIYRAILSVAPKIKGDVLDLGCGSKPYQSLFVNAHSYVGVDIAVSGHDHRGSKVDVYYDGAVIPFADGSFDSVVSFEVFEHVFNLEEVISETRRVLKPGGRLLITVPFAWEEHEAPYDFARYTSYGMKHMLEKAGFDILEMRKTTTCVLAVCQMFIAYISEHVLPQKK
jgi:SAM-dependent methyltransferase